jgi:uncharacterized protein (TIGR03435 family)
MVGALKAQPSSPTALLVSQAADNVEFDDIAIHPALSGGPNGMMFRPGGRFEASNVTLRMLIANAYARGSLQPIANGQIAGGPAWIDSDRFDIVATTGRGVEPGFDGRLQSMLRKLLADRFMLVLHDETLQRPTYALAASRADGTIGPRLQPSAANCGRQPLRGPAPPPPPPAPAPDSRPRCGLKFVNGSISAGGVTMAQFANAISRYAGRVVVDQTALGGTFDLDLDWAPATPGADSLPAIVAAMEEQLSLRLDPQVSAVDVLVIDRAEKPRDYQEVVLTPPPPLPPPPPPPPAVR